MWFVRPHGRPRLALIAQSSAHNAGYGATAGGPFHPELRGRRGRCLIERKAIRKQPGVSTT